MKTKHQKSTEGRLVPLREVSDRRLLPVSVKTLMRLIESGRIRAVNIGAGARVPRWAVSESEIERYRQAMTARDFETK